MAKPRQNSLFKFPGINIARLQHVAAVVRLDNYRGTTAQAFADERRNMAKVHQSRNLDALMRCCEAEIVDCVVRNCERMKVDLANTKVLTRFYLLDPIF